MSPALAGGEHPGSAGSTADRTMSCRQDSTEDGVGEVRDEEKP